MGLWRWCFSGKNRLPMQSDIKDAGSISGWERSPGEAPGSSPWSGKSRTQACT